MKTVLESIVNRADRMKERIGELKDRNIELIQIDEERELRFFFNKQMLMRTIRLH